MQNSKHALLQFLIAVLLPAMCTPAAFAENAAGLPANPTAPTTLDAINPDTSYDVTDVVILSINTATNYATVEAAPVFVAIDGQILFVGRIVKVRVNPGAVISLTDQDVTLTNSVADVNVCTAVINSPVDSKNPAEFADIAFISYGRANNVATKNLKNTALVSVHRNGGPSKTLNYGGAVIHSKA